MKKPKHHELKIWPEFYQQVASGARTFQIRRNDRDFEEGDGLTLREWAPVSGVYTASSTLRFTIGHVVEDDNLLAPGLCVFSLLPPDMKTETVRIQVRQANGTYKTSWVRGLSASCTSGDQQAAEALGRKLFGARFLNARQTPIVADLDYQGRTHWRLEATKA